MGAHKFLLLLLPVFVSCDHVTSTSAEQKENVAAKDTLRENTTNDFTHPENLLTLADAEKILGEKAHMVTNSTTKKETLLYQSLYEANNKDININKTGNVYFLAEQYPKVISAHESYIFFKDANEDNGINVLNDLGDEAYFHTDNTGFYFILVRKGDKMFRMKVNKITSHTSRENFISVARTVTARL